MWRWICGAMGRRAVVVYCIVFCICNTRPRPSYYNFHYNLQWSPGVYSLCKGFLPKSKCSFPFPGFRRAPAAAAELRARAAGSAAAAIRPRGAAKVRPAPSSATSATVCSAPQAQQQLQHFAEASPTFMFGGNNLWLCASVVLEDWVTTGDLTGAFVYCETVRKKKECEMKCVTPLIHWFLQPSRCINTTAFFNSSPPFSADNPTGRLRVLDARNAAASPVWSPAQLRSRTGAPPRAAVHAASSGTGFRDWGISQFVRLRYTVVFCIDTALYIEDKVD